MKHVKGYEPNAATLAALVDAAVDVTGAAFAEVIMDTRRRVIHVNVNGVCVLRVCQINLKGLRIEVKPEGYVWDEAL